MSYTQALNQDLLKGGGLILYQKNFCLKNGSLKWCSEQIYPAQLRLPQKGLQRKTYLNVTKDW